MPLPGRHHELLTGTTVEEAVKLERYGVAVLDAHERAPDPVPRELP
ncbi:Beta-galactosidase C-terminal domain [Streptomyces sp. NPDC058326]